MKKASKFSKFKAVAKKQLNSIKGGGITSTSIGTTGPTRAVGTKGISGM